MDQDKIIEQKMRDIAEQVYAEKTLKSKYGVAQVPFHTHNGTDSSQIFQKDLINNIKNSTSLVATVSGTISLKNVPNLTRISFYGSATSAGGVGTTQGQAEFGRCYNFSGVDLESTTAVQGIPFIQACSGVFFSAITTNAVATNGSLGLIYSGGIKAEIKVLTYDTATVTFQITLAAGWTLQGILIFT